MNIQEAIEQLKKLPPDGKLVVASIGHGGSVPLQGFIDIDEHDKEAKTHWIDVIYCDDKERVRYGLPDQQPTAQQELESKPLPEHIPVAARDLCEYIPPSELAHLVDDWSEELETLPLAQIALDAGIRNCGLTSLLNFLPSTDWDIIERWEDAGLQFVKP